MVLLTLAAVTDGGLLVFVASSGVCAHVCVCLCVYLYG
jgi:hypothetical protein